MAGVLNERRDSEWRQGWKGSTSSPISAPPLPLLGVVAIVVFLLWVSSYLNYKSAMQTATTNVNLFLLLLPLALILIAQYGRLVVPSGAKHVHGGDGGSSSSPWGWGALVAWLLVLVSHYRLPLIFVFAIVFLYVYLLSI